MKRKVSSVEQMGTRVISTRVTYGLALKIEILAKRRRESVNDWSKRALAIVAHYTEAL